MNAVKQKKYNLINNIFYVYKGVAKHKPYMIVLLFVSLISTVGSRFVGLFLSKYIIEFICDGISGDYLIKMVLILSTLNFLFMLGQNAVNFGKEPGALYVRPMFMLQRNKKHIGMFYENLECKEILDVIEKSRKATSWVETGIEGIIRFTIVICSDVFTCIIAMVILGSMNIYMIFVVIIFGILSYFSIDKAAKKDKYLTNDSVSHKNRKKDYFNRISRDFSYGKDIRLYNVQQKLLGTQKDLHKELHSNVCKARNVWLRSGIFTGILDMLREGVMYIGLVFGMLNKRLIISDFTLYVGCVRQFAGTFHNVMSIYAKMRQCNREVNDYRTLNEFIDEQETSGVDIKRSRDYEIRFDNVSFSYPGTDKLVLKNINLTITPKQKLAVVGLNGAGKTTFVKLLMKLYEPTNGRILLNGVDIKNYNTKSYYELFAPVFQDMECYAFSLAENVSMKSADMTDKELVNQCVRKAGLGNKLDEWTNGVDTNILKILHNDGVILSGGEMQKLALARALYKDAPIVVLDEPTAALDAIAESKMYEDFDKLVSGKMAIYISHRLASTRFCDVIAMFNDGEIVEYGSHNELMSNDSGYAKMFEMQANYYREGQSNEAV
ncbi:MAG: ABC transporter ATP-binding protein [Lachnospiraceae bacterium]|nr:ABC transporter ATP-binding protein [Lachnospiraceae bacterium]